MSNRAAQELAELTQATQAPLEEAANMAARDKAAGTSAGDPRKYDRDNDGEASYALPEGLATAVVGTFLGGPAAGLALGIAQAWLGKQERQGILDQWARDNDTWDQVEGVLNERLDTLKPTNENDVEQINNYRAQQSAALKLVRSGNPNMQQRGGAMLDAINTEINSFTERQETQRLEQEAIDEQIARELNAEQRELYVSELNRFEDKSENYLTSIEKANEIRAQLKSGNPASLSAAIVGLVKLQDPTSAAMEGEVSAWRGIGNLTDKLMGYVNQLDEGRPLTVDQARDFNSVVDNIVGARKQIQLQRQSRARARLESLEIPQKYWGEFDIVSDYPAVSNAPLTWEDDVKETGAGVVDKVEETGENVLDWLRGQATDAMEGASNWATGKRDEYIQERAFREEFRRIHGRYPTELETNPGVN